MEESEKSLKASPHEIGTGMSNIATVFMDSLVVSMLDALFLFSWLMNQSLCIRSFLLSFVGANSKSGQQ
jgi:hypothetical protein